MERNKTDEPHFKLFIKGVNIDITCIKYKHINKRYLQPQSAHCIILFLGEAFDKKVSLLSNGQDIFTYDTAKKVSERK
jgi:hypothetical protein